MDDKGGYQESVDSMRTFIAIHKHLNTGPHHCCGNERADLGPGHGSIPVLSIVTIESKASICVAYPFIHKPEDDRKTTFQPGELIIVDYDVPTFPESLRLGVWWGGPADSATVQ